MFQIWTTTSLSSTRGHGEGRFGHVPRLHHCSRFKKKIKMNYDAPSYLAQIATDRHDLHKDHASSRPLSINYEGVGISGEVAFSAFSGIACDLSERPSGDKGIDFIVPLLFSIDVKTARIPNHLIHEKGKDFVDIYVLAEYVADGKPANLIGWEYGIKLKNAPFKDFGYGIINHYIHRSKLRPMADLKTRLLRFTYDSQTETAKGDGQEA